MIPRATQPQPYNHEAKREKTRSTLSANRQLPALCEVPAGPDGLTGDRFSRGIQQSLQPGLPLLIYTALLLHTHVGY